MKNYKYRVFRLWEYLLDMFLQPFMYPVGSKDAHWWDWEPYHIDETDLADAQLLKVGKGPAQRRFPNFPVLGKYNHIQLKSLFVTLFVLKKTNVIKPKEYTGYWSLICYKEHVEGKPKMHYISRFLYKGPVKNLADGEIGYLGLSQEGAIIEVELVEVCSRFKNRKLLFV